MSIMQKEKVVLIVQSRMNSTRLPGKSLMDLGGKPLISQIIERLSKCREVDELVVAIPDTQANDILANVISNHNVTLFRGSEENLLDRYYKAALSTKADIVGRFPADNPVPEPYEIDKIILHHRDRSSPCFSSNLAQIQNSGYPDGIGAEIFDFTLLEDAWRNEDDPMKLEHVHLNFYNYDTGQAVNDNKCPISTISCPKEFARPDIILDVNTLDQYLYLKEIYDFFNSSKKKLNIQNIIEWHDNIYEPKVITSKFKGINK